MHEVTLVFLEQSDKPVVEEASEAKILKLNIQILPPIFEMPIPISCMIPPNMSYEQFTSQHLFQSDVLEDSNTEHMSLTRNLQTNTNKGKEKATATDEEEVIKDLVSYMKQSGSAQFLPEVSVFKEQGKKRKSKIEEVQAMMEEQKRLADLRASEKASGQT